MAVDPSQRDKLLALTRNGPVESWNSRIALIAESAGLRIEMIAWSGSPAVVALDVLEHALRNNRLGEMYAAMVRAEYVANER
jgi:hypothetical protein